MISHRMKILVVTPYPVLPLTHGGRVRTFRLAAGLARSGADVSVLCPWSPGQPRRAHDREGVTIRPHLLPANALLAVPDHWLHSAVAHSLQPYRLGPSRLLKRGGPYDIVQFDFCAYPRWMERIRGDAALVYSAHNVESDLYGADEGASRIRRALARRLHDLERDTVLASDLVVTCTERDAARMRSLYDAGASCVVIPNGFDPALVQPLPEREAAREALGIAPSERVLLFHGGAARHNLDAVRFLCDTVMPQLASGTRLLVAGRCAEAASEREDVTALGYVEDLRPHFAAADLALNPVSRGSGSNIKMAEYLAAGLTVVSTPVGARGYEEAGPAVRLASTAEFAATVTAALEQPAPARAQVDDLRWDRLGARLGERYRELTH